MTPRISPIATNATENASACQLGLPTLARSGGCARSRLCLRLERRRRDLIGGLGSVVAREHAKAPYPLSMEIFQITDSLRAIGACATAIGASSS
jgi:hypothetical protein